VLKLIADLIDFCRAKRLKITNIENNLKAAKDYFEPSAHKYGTGRSEKTSPLIQEITDASDVDRFYGRGVRHLGSKNAPYPD